MNEASQKMYDAVARAKKEAELAEKKFDQENDRVQAMSMGNIDLFSASAFSKVGSIVSAATSACRSLHGTYHKLIHELNRECKPLIEQGAEANAIKAVFETIVHFNEESYIDNNYSANVDGIGLGEIASGSLKPSAICERYEDFWGDTYRSLPEVIEAERLAKERAKEATIQKAKKAEERSALYQENIEFEKARLTDLILQHQKEIQEIKKKSQLLSKEYQARVSGLQKALSELGIFAGKQKKEIRQKIEAEEHTNNEAQKNIKNQITAKTNKINQWTDKLGKLDPQEGDIFTYGIDPLSPVRQPLKWVVVKRDGVYVKLLSMHTLHEEPYNQRDSWMKKVFTTKAFTDSERDKLVRQEDQLCVFPSFNDVENCKYIISSPSDSLRERIINKVRERYKGDTWSTNYYTDSHLISAKEYFLNDKRNGLYKIKTIDPKGELRERSIVVNDPPCGIRPMIIVDLKRLNFD